MSVFLDAPLMVSRITVVRTDEHTITTVLTGVKTFPHETPDGYSFEDAVEIKLSLKCKLASTLKDLGIESVGHHKLLSLRDRDTLLEDYGTLVKDMASLSDVEP